MWMVHTLRRSRLRSQVMDRPHQCSGPLERNHLQQIGVLVEEGEDRAQSQDAGRYRSTRPTGIRCRGGKNKVIDVGATHVSPLQYLTGVKSSHEYRFG